MNQFWRSLPVVLLIAVGFGAGTVLAQTYPRKPVRIVVNMPPGGVLDMAARSIGQKLTESWKQPVLIDNRAGSGGNIGADAVAKATPDGYTLLMSTSGLAISPSLYRKLPFDPLSDFVPVSQLYSTFLVLVTNSGVPVTSVRELIALAKSKPGSLNYGHSGVGSTLQLTTELLKTSASIDILAVPYKGTAPISTALVTREVDLAFMPLETVVSYIKAGKLRALALTSRERSPLLPDVPTMAEAGMHDFGLPGWYGLFAPAGTPREIVELIQRDTIRALNMPDVRDRIRPTGAELVGSTAEEFHAKYKADVATFARIVTDARIPPQD
jgi:tripartite-type tricarboxylate transporter receptor subunit TctC